MDAENVLTLLAAGKISEIRAKINLSDPLYATVAGLIGKLERLAQLEVILRLAGQRAVVEFTRHTCTPDGQALPFGRKAPVGDCPRCDELRAGAAPRAAHPAIQAGIDRRANEARQLAELEEHFASEQHRTGGCGVCTFGQW